jgi:outer membrane immunogenic protein
MPAGETPFTWTGLYFGVHGGYIWPKSGSELSDGFCERDGCGGPPGPSVYRAKLDEGSFFGGGQVGYNHQFDGGFVLGAEADISIGQKFSGAFWYRDNEDPDEGTIGNVDLHAAGSARLKAGFAMDRWMPFVTGGVAFAKYDANFSWDDNKDTPRYGDGALFGYAVGAGINYAVSNNFILGLEWRGTHYQDDSVSMTNPDLDSDAWSFITRLKTSDVRLSGSVKF